MNNRIITLLLVAFLVMSFSVAGSEYYLIPSDNNVSVDDNVTEVEIWLNATVPVASGLVRVNYTYCCINITDYVANTTYFEDVATVRTDGQVNTAFTHWGANSVPENQPIGLYHIGNLTIECCDRNCTTNLLLIKCELFDWFEYGPAGEIPFNVTNGSFACNTSDEPKDPEPCLGSCYYDSNCTELAGENMSCCECIGSNGFWHPNLDEACFGNNTPSDLCLDWCPECVNCYDDDNDTFEDYPSDPECSCGLDPSEREPLPPIPEAGTGILVGLGLGGLLVCYGLVSIIKKVK